MRTIIATVVLVLAATVANAAPIYLSCKGTWELNGLLEEVSGEATAVNGVGAG
jgi:hypothetical protein